MEILVPLMADSARVESADSQTPVAEARSGPDASAVADGGSDLVIPLTSGDRLLATLVLQRSSSSRHRFDGQDAVFARQLCDRAALALQSARLIDEEHDIAVRLQRALLPEALPAFPSAAIAAVYRAGLKGLEVGGDWYDAIELPEGKIGVMVGDVVGRGLPAAAVMGRLRTALSAFAQASSNPAAPIEQLDLFARRVAGASLATVCYAVLDPVRQSLSFSSAGHPPPIMMTPGGEVEVMWGGRSAPLCVLDGARAHARVDLPAGSTVLFYSDGLVERRGEVIDLGIGRLVAALARRADASVDDLCAEVLEDLTEGRPQQDDVALLCVRTAVGSRAAFSAGFPAQEFGAE